MGETINKSDYFIEYGRKLEGVNGFEVRGKVMEACSLVIKARIPFVRIGELCKVKLRDSSLILAEVVGFKGDSVYLMPFTGIEGIRKDDEIVATGNEFYIKVSERLMGRVLDGLGNPIDGKGKERYFEGEKCYVSCQVMNPLERNEVRNIFQTGIRSIDALLTCGEGQRVGIFSAAGVGKSSLLGMIARNGSADINIIGLIGERGREVREFIQNQLGEEGMSKSVVIASTSDTPALVRVKATFVACSLAEYFCNRGKKVLLLIDSVTRLARAQREIGLAIGEPPARYGYTPSVFALLPKIVERAGNLAKGCITAFYTVLMEGDDPDEPISDEMRSLLDGHIILSRELAYENHYPAVDVLKSISRVMNSLISDEHKAAAKKLIQTLSTYEKAKDAILIGAYKAGSNKEIDYAIEKLPHIKKFLQQDFSKCYSYKDSISDLINLAN